MAKQKKREDIMKTFYTLAIAAIAVIGLALFATPALAVHAGTGQGLTCGACHTMHSSQGGTSVSAMGGATGSTLLLRVAIANKYQIGNFCLSCHAENGAQAATPQNSGVWLTTPPKVYRTTAWTNGDFTEVGAGGDFNGSGAFDGTTFTNDAGDDITAGGPSTGKGHSINLQAADIMPPGSNSGAGGIESFTCTTCHDPHGTTTTIAAINKYRNLRGNISDGGNGIEWTADIATSYVGGVGGGALGGTGTTVANNTWPVYRSATSQNSYSGSATAGAQFSRFCAQCHGDWHEVTETGNGINNWAVSGNDPTSGNFDWQRHPVDAALVAGGQLAVNLRRYDS